MNMQEFSWTDVGLFFWKDICHTHEEFEYNDHNIHDRTNGLFEWRGEGGGVKESRVKLAENRDGPTIG